MFFFQPRRVAPVQLSEQFTPAECDRISRLHRQFLTTPVCFKLDINYRRLEFARWLVEHGRLNEGYKTLPDPRGDSPGQ